MRALITGIEGQDGFYLSRLLQEKGYEVMGVVRKKAMTFDEIHVHEERPTVRRIYADLNDYSSIMSAISETQPDEIYNLAGQSEIPLSWKQPFIMAEVNAIGVLRVLEAIRIIKPDVRFFQASSSEIFGDSSGKPCNEESAVCPRNPYGTAKLFAHNCVKNYREHYGLFACNGILFNHESPRRNPEFVTRKITIAAARAALGYSDVLELGNLNAMRDWGCAIDYVRAMWELLQRDRPQDTVIATGESHTVREFTTVAYSCAGRPIVWENVGLEEKARFADTGELAVRVEPSLVRYPLVDTIVSDPKKLYQELHFTRSYQFRDLVSLMVQNDIQLLKKLVIRS